MATTDYDFQSTRNQVIERAHRLVLGPQTTALSAEEMAYGVLALNEMIKSWQSGHVFLWKLQKLSFSTAATDKDYTLSTDPAVAWVDKAWLVHGTNDVYELEQISYRQYLDIEDPDSTGDPTHFAIDNQLGTPVMYVWPTPTQVKTINYLGVVLLKDAETASDNLDFPVRWSNALTYGLAAHLADEYLLPIRERQHLERKALDFFSQAKRGNNERSSNEHIEGAFD